MNSVKSILIVGVGGQGTLLASRLLGNAVFATGTDVKISEVHGMSQRGGSVMTYVRYGDKVHSPIIDLGEADVILSFELLEAARYLPYLKKGGTIVVNTQQIDPIPVITGDAQYPSDIIEKLKRNDAEVIPVDALSIALDAGSVKTVNVVLMARAAKVLGIPYDILIDTIRNNVPEKFIEMNLKAFELSYNK